MKKIVFVLFGSILLSFNVRAQAQLKEFYFTCDQYIPSLVQDSIIDNSMTDPWDFERKTNQIFISKNQTPNYAPLNIVLMHFNLFDVNNEPIVQFPVNRFKVQVEVTGNGSSLSNSAFFLTEDTYQYDLMGIVQLYDDIHLRITITDMVYSLTFSPELPYNINSGFPILRKIIIYNPQSKERSICNSDESQEHGYYIYAFNNMNITPPPYVFWNTDEDDPDRSGPSIYRDDMQERSFQWMSSTGGAFTEIEGEIYPNLQASFVDEKTYYIRKVIYTTSAGIETTYFSNDTLITLTPGICGIFATDISGPETVTPNQTSVYSVAENIDFNNVWFILGGDIVSGQGTHSITVLWKESLDPHKGLSVVETDPDNVSKYTFLEITATTTGINKGFASSGISVFPNPIKNQFTVEMPTANTAVNYIVYSTTGVQMQSGSFNAAASGNTISTQLPAGMYQLVLDYDGVFTSTKLVVSGQ